MTTETDKTERERFEAQGPYHYAGDVHPSINIRSSTGRIVGCIYITDDDMDRAEAEADACVLALATAHQPPASDRSALDMGAVPEGWKLVPVEPTPNMAFAGIHAVGKSKAYDKPGVPGYDRDLAACNGDVGAVRAMQSYRAQISAAPLPPASASAGKVEPVACIACEGHPQAPNDPCAVCGKLREYAEGRWRDISTAPKDGTVVLLFCPKGDGSPGCTYRVTAGNWEIDPGGITEHRDLEGRYISQDEREGWEGWISWDGGFSEDTMMPTHWMPLPSPPKEPEASIGEAVEEIEPAPNARQAAEEMREACAKWIDTRRDDYISEHGSYDYSTGVTEFPGDGEEYVGELEEIAEAIRAIHLPGDKVEG